MTKEALKLALDALTSGDGWRQSEAIKTIEEALAQHDSVQAKPEPEQEPVAKYTGETYRCPMVILYKDIPIGTLLYTTPPQRKPLPPQSPCEMTQAEGKMFKLGWLECEAAHGIKENT